MQNHVAYMHRKGEQPAPSSCDIAAVDDVPVNGHKPGKAVTASVYRAKIAGHSRVVTVSWSRDLLSHAFAVAISGADGAAAECRVELRPWQFWRRAGSRRVELGGGSSTPPAPVRVLWDLRRARFGVGIPEPRAEEHRPVVHPEVILCVEIYQKRYGSVKSQEFLVLGSQFLTDLRDNIYCSTDKLMKVAGQHDHSGYFLIEDTFYNDTRHYSATDYSKPILEWLNNSSDEVAEKWDAITSGVLKKRQKDLLRGLNISNVPEFKSEKMQRTLFSDLQFRLGAGYLYCHQGNCKHMMVIRDVRLIHPEDTQNQAEYPLMTFQLQKRFQKCSVCQIYHATKMTVDDKWALNNPCYFCIKCYYLLHYKEDGSLLYPHTVYDYIQE